jgi:hypothetical protein
MGAARRSIDARRATRLAAYGQKPTHPQTHRGGVRLDEDRGRQRNTKSRGCDRVEWAFAFAAAAYNLVRLPKVMAGAVP